MTTALAIKQLTYKRNQKPILTNVSLNVEAGKIVGLLGENGAGKTTLMRLISGLAKTNQGEIITNQTTTNAAAKRATVSFSDQLNWFPKQSKLQEIVAFYQHAYPDFDYEKYQELANFLQLDPLQKLSALSKGTKEKFVITLTLARQTDIYLLDEPFSGIDSMSRKKIINSIIQWKPEAALMIISDHYVSEIAPILDDIVVIKDQTIAVHRSADSIREEFGIGIEAYYEGLYEGGAVND